MDKVSYPDSPAALKRRIADGFSDEQQQQSLAENATDIVVAPTSPDKNSAVVLLDNALILNLSSSKDNVRDKKSVKDLTADQSLITEENADSQSSLIANEKKDSHSQSSLIVNEKEDLQSSLIINENEDSKSLLINSNEMVSSEFKSLIPCSLKNPQMSPPSENSSGVKESLVKNGGMEILTLNSSQSVVDSEQQLLRQERTNPEEGALIINSIDNVAPVLVSSILATTVEQQDQHQVESSNFTGDDPFKTRNDEKKPAVSAELLEELNGISGASKFWCGGCGGGAIQFEGNSSSNGGAVVLGGNRSSTTSRRSLEIELIDETALIDITKFLTKESKISEKRRIITAQTEAASSKVEIRSKNVKVRTAGNRKGSFGVGNRDGVVSDRKGKGKWSNGRLKDGNLNGGHKGGRISGNNTNNNKKKKMIKMVYRMKEKVVIRYKREEIEGMKNVNLREQRKMWQGIYRGFEAAVRKEYDGLRVSTTTVPSANGNGNGNAGIITSSVFNKQTQSQQHYPYQYKYHNGFQQCRMGVKNNGSVHNESLPLPPVLNSNNGQGLIGFTSARDGGVYLNSFVYNRRVNHY